MPKILALVAMVFLIFSCKKEKTTWSTNWTAPLVHGTLTLDDLIDTAYQETNGDGYVSLVINEPVYSFSVDNGAHGAGSFLTSNNGAHGAGATEAL